MSMMEQNEQSPKATFLEVRRSIYYPPDAHKVEYEAVNAVVYLYSHPVSGKPCVTMFTGRKTKPTLRYCYGSEDRRESAIQGVVKNLSARAERTRRTRESANQPHRWEKGLILVASWGYDQTNINYYEIIDVPSPCYVVLQEIGAPLARGEEGFMSGNAVPDPEHKIGQPFRRKVNMVNGAGVVRISSFSSASIWDGKEKYRSWYA